MISPLSTLYRNPRTNTLLNPNDVKNSSEITSLGKATQKLLREWGNETYSKNYKNITQFQKQFKLKNKEETFAYLQKEYNKQRETRITEQKKRDKDDKNKEITFLKAKAKESKEQQQTLYIQEITIVLLKRTKGTKEPFIQGKSSITAFGNTKQELQKKIKTQIDREIDKLKQDSPTEIVIQKVVMGKLYSNENMVEINRIRMRDENALLLDTMEKPEWDTGNGKCVYDSIIHSYNKTKGLIKKMNYEYLTSIFTKYDEENENPLENGVSVEQIFGLCDELNMSCYAFDIRDNCIKKRSYNKERGGYEYKAFVFRVWNNHIYPITDEKQKKSLITLQREKLTIMNTIQQEEKEKENKIYNIVEPTENEDCNDYATKYIFEAGRVPFPFTSNKIKYDNGKILSFKIGDDLILTEKGDDAVKEYIEKTGKIYQGETSMSLLYELWNEYFGKQFNHNDLMSNLSPTIYDVLTGENVKYRTHYGNTSKYETHFIKEQIELGNVVGGDITKCYSSILDNPMSDWLVYDLYDEIEPWGYYHNDITEIGLYRVETGDFTLLHGTNWYSHTILMYAKHENIDFNITHQFIPKRKENNRDYFKPYITFIMEQIGYDTKGKRGLIKNILNAITGLMGRTSNTNFITNLTTDINEVWNGIGNDLNKINKMFLKSIEYKDKTLHLWGTRNDKDLLTNNLPNYIQILDQSNIKIYQLQKKIGGELIFRKTDAIICYKGEEFIECDDTKRENWGTYKIESKQSLLHYDYDYKMNPMRYVNGFNMKDFNFNKNLYDSDQFKEIFEYANEKGGLLICAKAGTGKSYLFNKWVETELVENDERIRLAFTNRARRNINGTTIHTAFSINDEGKANKKMMNTYKNKKVIMVDEIGMISVDLWRHLLMLKKQFPYLIFILCGDYRQLPPIEIWGTTYFNSEIVKYLCNNNSIELTVRKRYDEEMGSWLDNFYEKGIVDWTKLKVEKHDWNGVNIVYYNKTRDSVNDLFMNHFKPQDAYYLPYERKNKDDRHKSIYLYKGLPVMSIKNKTKLELINSDELIVEDYDVENKMITMKKLDDDSILEISFDDFHKIFVCAYAFTVHKIQGATMTEKINIWNKDVILNDKNIGYTAISRAKKLNQIIIVK